MPTLLTVIVVCLLVGFIGGAIVGMVYEQMLRRVPLRQTALHLAVRRLLDAEAAASRHPRADAKLEEYRAARSAVSSMVGWEPPPAPSNVVALRTNTRLREERPAC